MALTLDFVVWLTMHTRKQRIRKWGVGEREEAGVINSGFLLWKGSEGVKIAVGWGGVGAPARILLHGES